MLFYLNQLWTPFPSGSVSWACQEHHCCCIPSLTEVGAYCCRAATSQGADRSNSDVYFAVTVWVTLQKNWGLTIQFTFGKKTNRKIQLLFHVWPFKIPYELLSIKNVINSQSLVMIKNAGINPYIVTWAEFVFLHSLNRNCYGPLPMQQTLPW